MALIEDVERVVTKALGRWQTAQTADDDAQECIRSIGNESISHCVFCFRINSAVRLETVQEPGLKPVSDIFDVQVTLARMRVPPEGATLGEIRQLAIDADIVDRSILVKRFEDGNWLLNYLQNPVDD